MNLFNLSAETEKCRERLESILSRYARVAVAFSGGVDSTLLLEAVSRYKTIEFIAVIVKTQLNPRSETEAAVEFLKAGNFNYILIESDILSEKKVSLNPHDRCYHCKKLIFNKIIKAAESKGFHIILDGTHSEDLHDYRPGLLALSELGIISPLKEAGFRKENIRELAKYFGLSNWSVEASPCIATRIPFGTEITEYDLRRIEKGEACLKENGFTFTRLRIHGNIVRIEIHPDQFIKFSDITLRKQITEYIRSLGFDFITLDLEGYRTGSMNLNK